MPRLKNTIDLKDIDYVRNALKSSIGRTEDDLAHIRVFELHSMYVHYLSIVKPSRRALTYRPFFKILRMLDIKIKGRGTPIFPCAQNIAKITDPVLYYGLNHEDNGKPWTPNFMLNINEKRAKEISKIRSEAAKKHYAKRKSSKK